MYTHSTKQAKGMYTKYLITHNGYVYKASNFARTMGGMDMLTK